jgi:hypothetical protein
MATSIQNNLLEYYFSSQLPDLRWQTDEEALTVSLYCPIEGVDILELTLTAVGGYVDLQEVRDAVERKMRYLNKDQIYLQVRWKEPSARIYNISGGCNVYYCVQNIVGSCSAWIEAHFLTTLKSKPLPGENATERLYFYASRAMVVTPQTWVTCRLSDGTVRTIEVSYFGSVSVSDSTKGVLSWTLPDMLDAAQDENEDVEEVLAVAINAGSRIMNYYKPRITPNLAIAFLNCFSLTEIAWLNCVTTKKTKDGRKVAHVAHRAKVYDLDPQVTYETETCPLPLEVADWLSQLVTAQLAWLGDGTAIVITEGDASISDDAAVMNTLKFTWQRDDSRDLANIDGVDINIFNQPPFGYQFD